MKLFKYFGVALLGIALLMTQSVNFSTDNNLVWVSLNFNGAEASQDRRVARRTSRRTASRQSCGSSWC